MNRFKNILCVAAPAETCIPALERAILLAENNRADLTVAMVMPRFTAGIGMPDGGPISGDLQAAMKADRLQILDSLTKPYRQRLHIEHKVLMGIGFLEIIRSVLRNGHDLVIKPAENPNFLERLFGSDDMHLLRKCPCPVWLTKPLEKAKYNCILAAVDFDLENPDSSDQDLNQQILQMSSALALSNGASLHLLHAWDAPGETDIGIWRDNQNERVKYVAAEHSRHQKGLDHLQEQLREQIETDTYDLLSPRFHLQKGEAAKVIPKSVQQLHADVVIMGTVARTGISGFFIGNTAEAILEQVQCSVLAIKPPGFVSPILLDEGANL